MLELLVNQLGLGNLGEDTKKLMSEYPPEFFLKAVFSFLKKAYLDSVSMDLPRLASIISTTYSVDQEAALKIVKSVLEALKENF